MQLKRLKKIVLLLIICGIFGIGAAMAVEKDLVPGATAQGDFLLSPARMEIFLQPGESTNRNIEIVNRSGEELIIALSVEDFTGNELGSVQLMGEEKGPYSLKDFVYFEEREFTLWQGERAIVPIAINLPVDVEPGGLYASVLAAAKRLETGENSASGVVKPVARLGALLFVRVEGNGVDKGELVDFSAKKIFFKRGDIDFQVTYENSGNVHQAPYGEIAIRNFRENTLGVIEVDPWFIMPGFRRTRELVWENNLGFGRYSAELTLYKNYDNQVDGERIVFWIIPWYAMIVLAGLAAVIVMLILLLSKYKKSKDKK